FTLSGNAGGSFLGTVGESIAGSTLTPQIALYDPNGKLLTFNQNASGTTITLNSTLPATGTYTVMVRDFNGLGTGGYAMTAVSLGLGIAQSAGGDGGFIASGVQKSPTITAGDIDVHPFFAVTNDKLVMTVAEAVAGSPLTPQIVLYDPNGKLLTFNQNATSTTITVLKAAATGMYFLVVRDFNGLATNVGGYKVNLTETPSVTKPTVTVAATD